MGSAYFLVAAIDRIERGLTGYLSRRRLPVVAAELANLRAAAQGALGPLADQVEIEDTQLLRRLIARRCICGVDLDPTAVQLARLSICIHTFVPGLPLSLLDHSLVRGNSLVGIGRLDEGEGRRDPVRARRRAQGAGGGDRGVDPSVRPAAWPPAPECGPARGTLAPGRPAGGDIPQETDSKRRVSPAAARATGGHCQSGALRSRRGHRTAARRWLCPGVLAGVYEPRPAAGTVLHHVVRTHLDRFLAETAAATDSTGVPRFVERELRDFLGCGALERGFARVRCCDCAFERLVPFSCKARAVCLSCGGRRMAEQAAHLVDAVLPYVPVRQWVLTVPHRLRYRLAFDHALCRAVLGVFVRAVLGWYRRRALGAGVADGQSGTVTVVQRFGRHSGGHAEDAMARRYDPPAVRAPHPARAPGVAHAAAAHQRAHLPWVIGTPGRVAGGGGRLRPASSGHPGG